MAATTTDGKATRRGFSVTCPNCNEIGVYVKVDDMTLGCTECDEEINPADVRALIGEWTRLLAWVESAPARPWTEATPMAGRFPTRSPGDE